MFYIKIIIVLELSVILTSTSSTLSNQTTNFHSTSKVQVPFDTTINGYYLKDLAASIGTFLQNISNRELGVPVMQEMYDSLEFVPVTLNTQQQINQYADQIINKTMKIIDLLYQYVQYTDLEQSILYPCSHVPSTYHIWTDTYNHFTVNNHSLHRLQYSSNSNHIQFNLSQVFSESIRNASQNGNSGIKQIYFLSSQDTVSASTVNDSYCTTYDSTNIWNEYTSRIVSKKTKNILILLEHGNGLSAHQLYLAKSMAKSFISMLKSNDTISVIALADTITIPFSQIDTGFCANDTNKTFVNATEFNKERLYNFIDSLAKSKNVTNHTLGFDEAFNAIDLFSKIDSNIHNIFLLYISRGLLSSITDAKIVFETIYNHGLRLSVPVFINTCLLRDDSKPLMYEEQFLTDIANINFTKYIALDVPETNYLLKAGLVQSINSIYNLGLTSARYHRILHEDTDQYFTDLRISSPKCDSIGKEPTVTISLGIGTNFTNYGIFGIDIYLNNLLEDILYTGSHSKNPYLFLINSNGATIMHRSLNQPHTCLDQNQNVDIHLLEKQFNLTLVKQYMEDGGVPVTFTENGIVDQHFEIPLYKNVFTCKGILKWYIICMVLTNKDINRRHFYSKKLARVSLPQNADVIHHRLDLLPPHTVCRHLKQITSIASGVLYLSASCFSSPYSQLRSKWDLDATPRTIEHYMAYLKDHTNLIANPGFKPDIRNEVLSLLHMMHYLKMRHLTGSLRQYAVRRYVASSGGVLQIYPGTNVQPGLDPTKRVWYQRALEHPGRVILTPPYLDAGGAGYIVTLSHTVYEGKRNLMHTTKDAVFAVMGIDLTLGYFYKLIIEKIPFCKQTNVKCFLMDDKGYLISHPSLVDPNGRGPVEQIHIVNKESIVANDILNQKYFVKKILCNNFLDGTMQRYYQFNTSFVGVIRNMIHGEHCSKYQITSIAGTNLFIGIVNSSCENSATFCPCSMVDRLCLNCNRMEQNECECPCECPLNLLKQQTCPNTNITSSFHKNPICPMIINEHFTVGNSLFYTKISNLKPCSNFHCELYTTQDSCMGIIGCEWCQINIDGETPLEIPFCTSLNSCFNGILGSVTPYGDSTNGPITSGDLLASTYSAIGPIVGCLVVLCLILSLIIYFYRQHYISIGGDELYLEGAPGMDQGQISGLRVNHLEMDDMNEERDGYRDRLMVYNLETVSPYRLSTGYRRPHTTGDSDHGYSTMTPHDESEHLSVALVEPLLTLNDENHSDVGSNSTSISTDNCLSSSVGSPQHKFVNSGNGDTTVVPTTVPGTTNIHRHCLLVPVTVHRDMETT
ncbi:VWFA and cache domain-containing protein 1 [Chrysoperla carnea]|uniref:VWFA and cache domain-containing protein 1 n=1 Tax=Chrysoperla carnea TaxID=189513 RepID=UPI001D097415|nr:VWFA and cache domain-containing protein 1 [Chrysoperla carnea]